MRRTSLPAVLAASLLLVLALVAGCGSSDSSAADGSGGQGQGGPASSPPTDASVEDFCTAFTDLIQQATQAGSDMSDAEAIELAKETADKLGAIGTPEDIPAEARAAFELAIEKIRSIPDDATREEMNTIEGDLTAEQQENLDALTSYVTTKCLSFATDLPSQ